MESAVRLALDEVPGNPSGLAVVNEAALRAMRGEPHYVEGVNDRSGCPPGSSEVK